VYAKGCDMSIDHGSLVGLTDDSHTMYYKCSIKMLYRDMLLKKYQATCTHNEDKDLYTIKVFGQFRFPVSTYWLNDECVTGCTGGLY
jgi:hypothetical protein